MTPQELAFVVGYMLMYLRSCSETEVMESLFCDFDDFVEHRPSPPMKAAFIEGMHAYN